MGDDLHLELVVGNDLGKLIPDILGIERLVAQAGEDDGGPVHLALLDEEAGGLREEEDTASKNEGPGHLETDGDTVRAAVDTVLGAVVNARGQEETDANAELVAGHESTADLAGRDLRHVQDDDGRDETDTETSDKTASNDEAQARRGSLENDTDDEDEAAEDDGRTTTNPISEITTHKGAEEGTSRENRGDEGLLPRGEGGGADSLDGFDKVLHAHDTGNITGIVAEEDTTERGKDAHHVRLEGNGSLNAGDIALWHGLSDGLLLNVGGGVIVLHLEGGCCCCLVWMCRLDVVPVEMFLMSNPSGVWCGGRRKKKCKRLQ